MYVQSTNVPCIWAPRPRSYLDVHDARLGEVVGQVLHHEEGLLLAILHLLADSMELRDKVCKHLHCRVCRGGDCLEKLDLSLTPLVLLNRLQDETLLVDLDKKSILILSDL